MDNRKIYWLLVIAGAVAAVAGIFHEKIDGSGGT